MALRRSMQALIAATVVGVLLLVGSAAGAVDDPDYTSPPPTTAPAPTTTVVVREVRRVPTAVTATPVRNRLAITGSDVSGLAALGGGLVLAGAGVLVLRRRRTSLA